MSIATQLNSTRRRVELSCVAINGPLTKVCNSMTMTTNSKSCMIYLMISFPVTLNAP